MKNLYIKDSNRRKIFSLLEKKKFILYYIIRNFKLSYNIRLKAYIYLINHPELSRISKIKNRCILSNRSKSIYRRFKLSRIFLKKYALEGSLIGVRKASW